MGLWPVPSFASSSAPPPEADPDVEAVARSAALEESGPATTQAVASAAAGGAESADTGGAHVLCQPQLLSLGQELAGSGQRGAGLG